MPSTDYYQAVVDQNIDNGSCSSRNQAYSIQPNPDLSAIHSEVCDNNDSSMTFSKNNSDIKKDKDSSCGADQKPKTRIDFGEHFPDGGWGWVITVAATVVYVLCSGIHYAFGIFYLSIQKEKKIKMTDMHIVWLGTSGLSISLLLTPAVVTICQRKSTRSCAVVGGVICSLGVLLLSFSNKVDQLFIIYCGILSAGTGISLSAAGIIVGRYFLQRRELAEMIMACGTGAGAVIMALVIYGLNRSMVWMKTMQCSVGIFILTIVAGALYRPASMYHPRRKMIMHIKSQKKGRRDHEEAEPSYFDFSALRMRGLQALMIISGIAAFGIYVPFIILIKIGYDRKMADVDLLLIIVYLGLGFVLGVVAQGYIIIKDSKSCSICRRCLCQANCLACGVLTLLLLLEKDYNSFALYAWGFGIFCGGYFYTLKMYTYEIVKFKIMERAWGFVCAAQFLPILIGSPISLYLNSNHENEHAGFIFAGVAMVLAGLLFFLMPAFEKHKSNSEVRQMAKNTCSKNSTEAAALLDLDLTDAMVTKPLNNVQFIVSPARLKHTNKEAGKFQMQCFIHQKEKEKPKQIVLSKITEEKEGLRLDFNEVSHGSVASKQNDSGVQDKSEADPRKPNVTDFPSDSVQSSNTGKSSSDSGNSKSESRKLKKNIDNVKIELFDPPSQEKESTATVSYDSDLYINLCEAQV
ncbi:monocarboxylate transporter 12-like isoform X1 [Saccostrea cucullata]|uniref:monocarboxylate transporter 12-like isoform X1 n=1 Tax=Saccostrea cuccullata TaxID=36930 RepID=UPI002ED246D6